MFDELLIMCIERLGRGVGFTVRFLTGIVSYDFWDFHVAAKHICLFQTPLCRVLRLSNFPRPSELMTVYGMAERVSIALCPSKLSIIFVMESRQF